MGWVIAGKPEGTEPVVGKVYSVRHSRKGAFDIQVTSVDGEWLRGVVVTGVALAAMSYNVKAEGESVTIRDVHTYLMEVE